MPPKPYPNLTYPSHKGWFSTKANMSPSAASAAFHVCTSGANLTLLDLAQRGWNLTTTPARATVNDYDITTPAYKLAGTTTTTDSVIGLDYMNPPIRFAEYLGGIAGVWDAGNANNAWARVLAINHKFEVRNFSRFPLELYYAVIPWGYSFQSLATTTPMDDLETTAYKKVVIGGVRDAGDRSKVGHIHLSLNMEKLFPDQYDKMPYEHSGDVITEESGSPWMKVEHATATSMYATCPPQQLTNVGSPETAALNLSPAPGLKMRVYARLQSEVDIGESAAGTNTGGDTDTNGFTIEGTFGWLMHHVIMTKVSSGHAGLEAYPNQTA